MKILMALSGGVDSSYSAYLLKNEGHDVTGLYLKLFKNDEYHATNIAKIEKITGYLGIDYKVLDLTAKFKENVYDYFIDSYNEGITPNPCVRCNREIKFGALVQYAKDNGFEKVATGHYVKVKNGSFYMAEDMTKDQTYFLAQVRAENLDMVLFPLANRIKKDVKAEVSKIEIIRSLAEQKESSEICFVPNTYIDVLKKHIDTELAGVIKNTKGEDVGEHKGYMHYTIGQRKGFTIRGALTPHYVVSIDAKNNVVVVGDKEDLLTSDFNVQNMNLFEDLNEFECDVKIRYRTKPIKCKVFVIENRVELLEPVEGVTKGQYSVFYDGDRLLGGAEIC